MLQRLPTGETSNAFLAKVLPDEGFKCALVMDAGTRWQEFFATTDELADYILEQDALGRTVYHACASFRSVGSRKSENALGSRAFWLDVDARTTHPDAQYADAFEAADAANNFCRSVGLPAPIYTASGGGIYLHWPLVETLGVEQWKLYADRLKQLCVQHGLHVDRVRTSDISSVLRTPGTHNRKGGLHATVTCGPMVGPYSIEQFEVLKVTGRILRVGATGSEIPIREVGRSLVDDALVLSLAREPSDAALASERCAQLRQFVERAGNIPEPDWYAGVEVYAHCREGDGFAHQHSRGHANYTFKETQGRLDRARNYGPTTCAHFESINPKGCEGCQHKGKITSPIQLGRQILSRQKSLPGQDASIAVHVHTCSTSGDPELDAEITRLARLPPLIFERERKAAAERFNLRASVLDKVVDAQRGEGQDRRQGRALELSSPEPWPESVDGNTLLSEISALLMRYVVMSRTAADATALWIIHTHLIEAADTTPRLAIKSPEKRCGKTTLLSIISHLAPRVLATSNISPAALFRTVEAAKPTLLIDEADTFVAMSDELRGIINSGHTHTTAFVVRTEGEDLQPRKFSTWAPIAFATIGKLPGTVEDRSIAIPLRRRRPDEKVERLRRNHTHLRDVASRAARWAADHLVKIADADPEIPEHLHDRAADNWRPLLAIADEASGDWPVRARMVAMKLSEEGAADQDSMRTMLLADIRAAFQAKGPDRLSSDELVGYLWTLEDRPWPEMNKGKPITKNGLARLLRKFGISSGTIRLAGERTSKGYYLSAFDDAFTRYLPSQNVTTSQRQILQGFCEV